MSTLILKVVARDFRRSTKAPQCQSSDYVLHQKSKGPLVPAYPSAVLCRRRLEVIQGVYETFLIKRQPHRDPWYHRTSELATYIGRRHARISISPIGVPTDERHAFECGQYRVVVTAVHDTFR